MPPILEDNPVIPRLDYVPSVRRRVSRRAGRWLIIATSFATAAVLISRNWNDLSHRAQWIYWSHRCANFAIAPDAELVVSDPAKIRSLAASRDYIRDPQLKNSLVYHPQAWQRLASLDERCKWFD